MTSSLEAHLLFLLTKVTTILTCNKQLWVQSTQPMFQAKEQSSRLDVLLRQCKQTNPHRDIHSFVTSLRQPEERLERDRALAPHHYASPCDERDPHRDVSVSFHDCCEGMDWVSGLGSRSGSSNLSVLSKTLWCICLYQVRVSWETNKPTVEWAHLLFGFRQ